MTVTEWGREPFVLAASPPFSRSEVNREEPLRDDREWQRATWRAARVLPVDVRGQVRLAGDGCAPRYLRGDTLSDRPPDGAVLLGEHQGVVYWAVRDHVDADDGRTSLRAAAPLLSDVDGGMLATAVSVLYWHDHAGFCAVCGARTVPVRAGMARDCTGCGRQEFPRIDPAVIVLVHDGADHVLLARQPSWPAGRNSVLAGFVEAGESLEATVAREIHEEVGVRVRDIRYLGSQPWPFPRSLMLGFAAVADRDTPLVPADGEIESARWVHRSEVLAAFSGETGHNPLLLPGGASIALGMLDSWARSG